MFLLLNSIGALAHQRRIGRDELGMRIDHECQKAVPRVLGFN